LYGCKNWSLTLREQLRVKLLKTVVLMIIGPKRDEVTWSGDSCHLYSEESHHLYASPSISPAIKSRRIRWIGHVARMGKRRGAYRILVGKETI
jgi:hypothetical protein